MAFGGFQPNEGKGGYSAKMPRGYTAKSSGGGQSKGVRSKREIGMPSRMSFRKSGRGAGR